MTHLKIQQNDNVEIVSPQIVEELHNISTQTNDVDLRGNLQTEYVYEDTYKDLTQNYDLTIAAPKKYVRFVDSVIENKYKSRTGLGDGVGVTRDNSNLVIVSNGSPNIDLGNHTMSFPGNFKDASDFYKNFPNLETLSPYLFQSDWDLERVDIRCKEILNNPGTNHGAFAGTFNKADGQWWCIIRDLESIGINAFRLTGPNTGGRLDVVFLTNVVVDITKDGQSHPSGTYNSVFGGATNYYIYVPDSLYNSYVNSNWNYSGLRKISQFIELHPELADRIDSSYYTTS